MRFLKEIFYLFFPNVCASCDGYLVKSENSVCLKCRMALGATNFSKEIGNSVEKTFYGRARIEFGTALLFYRSEGKTQQLIHQLKYKGNHHIGDFFGAWLGSELMESKRFPKVDYIIPVPLHPKKLKERGYNQLTAFGNRISKILQIPYIDTILTKKTSTETQTVKRRFERWKNVDELFYLTNSDIFKNKHVLIIDDVITTGATLEACISVLSETEGIKISVAAIAFTE